MCNSTVPYIATYQAWCSSQQFIQKINLWSLILWCSCTFAAWMQQQQVPKVPNQIKKIIYNTCTLVQRAKSLQRWGLLFDSLSTEQEWLNKRTSIYYHNTLRAFATRYKDYLHVHSTCGGRIVARADTKGGKSFVVQVVIPPDDKSAKIPFVLYNKHTSTHYQGRERGASQHAGIQCRHAVALCTYRLQNIVTFMWQHNLSSSGIRWCYAYFYSAASATYMLTPALIPIPELCNNWSCMP